MTSSSRADKLRWHVEERRAAAPRADLQSLLATLTDEGETGLYLLHPEPGVRDKLLDRYSGQNQVRSSAGSLADSVADIVDIAALRSRGPWLVRPGRPEQVGVVHVEGPLSAHLVQALAIWDGEGLLLGSEFGADWMLLDIDRTETVTRCEVLVSPDAISD